MRVKKSFFYFPAVCFEQFIEVRVEDNDTIVLILVNDIVNELFWARIVWRINFVKQNTIKVISF